MPLIKPLLIQSSLSPALLWFVALFPLVGMSLQALLAYTTDLPTVSLWIITLGICAWGCNLDQRRLLRNYHLKQPLDSPWFIPRYLYRRSRWQNQYPIFALIWSILIIIGLVAPWTGWEVLIKLWLST